MVRLTVVISGLSLSLGACGALQMEDRHAGKLGPAEQQQLDSSLNVASASADAGQTAAAQRLYAELSRHYPSAPEPRLGLAYLALQSGDFTRAGKHFAEADERSTGPAAKAEALLGAGRASLGEGDVAEAEARFLAAAGLSKGTPSEAWVANGLGVVATLEGDHERARKHFDEAVKLSSSHPIITANLVRALAQSGETDEARQLYAKYTASYWLGSDAADLSHLLKEAAPETAAKISAAAASPSGRQVQLFSARSRKAALAAWSRLSLEEKELLGGLSSRVVKAEVPKKGVFYRLRAGPLPNKAAAKRLCGLLKGRGRDCFVPAEKWTGGTGDGVRETARAAGNEPARAAASPSGGQVQLFSARSRKAALAAWSRLSLEEKELLGGLSSRVVRAEVPKKGVFYRLRAGPLPNKAAARRLCGLLKGRGRDCFVPAGKWNGGTGGGVQETVRPAGKEPARAAASASGGQVQLFSARSRSAAVAAWIRLTLEEKELLGGLSPRVVKAEVPKKGVFYRLRAGPLADRAAARRLCKLLKGRGRDCYVPAGKWTGGTGGE